MANARRHKARKEGERLKDKGNRVKRFLRLRRFKVKGKRRKTEFRSQEPE
jgi:hypothetical protein